MHKRNTAKILLNCGINKSLSGFSLTIARVHSHNRAHRHTSMYADSHMAQEVKKMSSQDSVKVKRLLPYSSCIEKKIVYSKDRCEKKARPFWLEQFLTSTYPTSIFSWAAGTSTKALCLVKVQLLYTLKLTYSIWPLYYLKQQYLGAHGLAIAPSGHISANSAAFRLSPNQ